MDTSPAVKRLEVRLFGRAQIQIESAVAAFPPRPGTRGLFVALAYSSQPRERDWLAATIWPDATQREGRANLRRHLLYIERWLSDLTGCARAIVRRRTQLALDPHIVGWLDVRAFEEAVAAGRFEDAVQIYGDDLLVDHDETWIVVERARLRARFDDVLLRLVSGARARNEIDAGLRYAQIARDADPYNETWLRTAMRLRYAAGDRAGALGEFESHRRLVRHDLDVEQMPETLMLAESIRRLDEGTVPVPLPLESTSFVGRDAESAELAALVARRRLVTVVGEPGIGKSRLAYRSARSVATQFRDGLFIVDGSVARDPDELERIVRRAFARGELGGIDTLDDVAFHEALLVIDGCESSREACARLAARLLEGAPGVRLLATSRVPLGIAGETVYRIGPLSGPDAVNLFLERLQLSRPGAVVTGTDLQAVRRICGRLDGLPLAVELAAARARVSALADVELDVQRFASRPGFDVLYAIYESSYQLLANPVRAVLRRLAAFVNGWTMPIALDACSDIAGVDGVREAFAALVEHSLVVPPAVSEADATYRMLDATRDFALLRARELGESDANAHALAGAIGRFYTVLGARLRGEHAADYYADIDRDRENIDGALETLWRGTASERALGIDLSLAVSRFWADQGFAAQGVVWLRRGLDDASTDDLKRLEIARVIATLTRDLGDYAASYRDFCELIRLQEAAKDRPVEVGKTQVMAANAARMTGDFDEALRRIYAACDAFIGDGEAYLAAWALYAAGTTYLSAGRFSEAATELERATDRFNELDAGSDSSSSIGNLALCHYYESRYDVALELAAESLSRAKKVGHRYYHAHAALNEALILHALGRRDDALASLIEACDIGRALGAQDVLISCGEAACAIIAASQAADAALLLGSVDGARERAHAHRFPVDIPLYERVSALLLSSLGGERLAALRLRGRVTPLRAAIERVVRSEGPPR